MTPSPAVPCLARARHRHGPAWVIPWLFLALAGPAQAQEGGSRSIFAQGVGNRALAMGGAFSALSDDPSGLLWNPGGLANIPRLQVEAGQTSYFSFGISETYALGALPNWRWGVAAASIRHIGVGDIEQRDSRNFVVGDPISDSQTEMTVGYGRRLGEFWSAGGSLKARHQSLGEFAASGFGADIGITGWPALALRRHESWAGELSWGMVISNLLRPSLRLDAETVSDPTSVRTGLAWHHALGGFRSVIAAVDLEHPAGLPTQFRSGVEFQFLPELSLRAGMDGGDMTAGAGLSWRDLSCNYAFENRPFDSVHRIGLSYAFGPSVTDSRTAAEQAEQERLDARLNEVFQERQKEQIDSLVARAQSRRAAGMFDDALELLGTAAALDPSRPDVTALQAACYRDHGIELERAGDYSAGAVAFSRALLYAPGDTVASSGHARCQAESDRRSERSIFTRQLFATALDDFGADRLASARAGFQKVLDIVPGDDDAVTMLGRTNEAIARRVTGLLHEAGQKLDAGRTAAASDLLDQVSALDPQAAGLTPMRTALSRALAAEQVARASAVRDSVAALAPRRPTPATSSLSKKEIETLYRRGQEAMKEGRADDALRFWELVWSANPKYSQVTEYLKREYLTRGMEAFANGRLEEASIQWRKALRVDPGDARAAGYLERAQKQLSNTQKILGTSN
jgi:tetratricopeptide (TPR) repeat protein